MTIPWPITFLLALLLQGSVPPPSMEDILDPKEKARIGKETKIDGRIKVYEAASKRLLQTLESDVEKEEYQTVPGNLELWIALLSKSLEDIEANLKSKKKSRALINYEIQVRKSIASLENLKIRVPVEQQDLLDEKLAQSEKVRKRFVEILFRH